MKQKCSYIDITMKLFQSRNNRLDMHSNYFVDDRPVHKLSFGPKCHELFAILYSIHANLSDDMFLLLYLRQKNEHKQNP